MHISDSPLSSDRLQFEDGVRSRSWDWLLALRRRLNVEVQLVDNDYLPTLDAGPPTTNLGDLLASGAAPLRSALFAAVRHKTTQAVNVDGVQFVCCAVTDDRGAAGALILARTVGTGAHAAEQTRTELEIIGQWLCSAVEAHLLAAPVAEPGGLDRLAALGRVFGDPAATSSDRTLVSRFADVLAVWHDLEAYGYVEDAPGVFKPVVWLPGADHSMMPAQIPAAAVPEVGEFARVFRVDAERVGFPGGQHVLIVRLGRESGSWLIVLHGPVDTLDLRTVGAYVSLLGQSLVRVEAVSVARVVLGVAKHLVNSQEPPEMSAAAALGEVSRALAAAVVTVTATDLNGATFLQAATADAQDGGVSEVRRTALHTTTLTAIPAHDQHVTPHEREIMRAVADLLEPWVTSVVARPKGPRERRVGARGFDQVIDRFAGQAIERGVPVTAMVVSVTGEASRFAMTRRWLGQLRAELRAADLVGLLGDGEIGLLLDDTSPDQAQTVIARLQPILAATEDADSPAHPVIGVASRVPGDIATRAIVQEAREQAFRNVS